MVLVVDDQPAQRVLLRGQLERLGVDSVAAASGAQALQALAQQRVGIVLLDCCMPQLSGYEVARKIRERECGPDYLPIIALSVESSWTHLEQCMDCGMDGALMKPLHLDKLRNLLHVWLGQKTLLPTRPAVVSYDPLLLASMYHRDLKTELASLHGAVARMDLAEVSYRAHRIKGIGLLIGAQAIVEEATALEWAGGAKASEMAVRAVERLHQAILTFPP